MRLSSTTGLRHEPNAHRAKWVEATNKRKIALRQAMKNARHWGRLWALFLAFSCVGSYLMGQNQDPVLVGAGDIADCTSSNTQGPLAGAQQTANLIDNIAGTVFAVGDLAYTESSDGNFAKCYDPTWGRHRARTIPVTGNHEYLFPNAADYFNYWGAVAGDTTKGYYSLDLGTWHVVVLNSNCSIIGGCSVGSPQEKWLNADLAAHPASCTLALWHCPLFSSTANTCPAMKPLFQDLYNAKAELVLSGHAHNYERFALQNPSGVSDPNGIRQFVVGTGGASHQGFGTIRANSEVRNGTTFGVLKLTLHPTSYDWDFVPVAGQTFTDSGSASCNGQATAPTITTTTLPAGPQNVAYSTTLAASGGVTPYTWSILSGTLPVGLSLTPSTGVISGMPTVSGTSSFTVKVTDANAQTATQALSITIFGGGTIALVQSAALQGSSVTSLSQAFPANNTAGNLIIVFVRASTTSQTVTVTDTAGDTYALATSQTQTTNGNQIFIFYATAKSQSNTVTAAFSGTNGYPWMAVFEYSGVSALDQTAHAQGSGVSANTGLTPTTTSNNELVFAGLGLGGASTVTVTAGTGFQLLLQDAPPNIPRAATEGQIVSVSGQYAGTFSLGASTNWSAVVATFRNSAGAPSITTTTLPAGSQNVAYSANLAASGGTQPYAWSLASGTLPNGLGLNSSTGVISGTPTALGTSSFTVQVTDANSQIATQALSITIGSGPSITTTTLPAGEQNVAYSATLAASGGTQPYAWTITLGTLPSGLTLNSSTGVISGTPTGSGTSSFTVKVTDANSQTATQGFSIVIALPPSITTTTLPSGPQNVAYSTTLAASGGTQPYAWTITLGTLPIGLGLNSSTGVISGTPTVSGTSSFTVKVTDANAQTATQALSITISPAGVGGTIALVQSAALQGSSVTSLSQAFPANNTAGNLIIVFVRASTTSQTVTVTDTAGNTYALAVSQTQTSDGHQIDIFYATSAASSPNTVTATFSASNSHPWLAVFEYSGVSGLDQTAHAQGSGASPNTGLTATTTSNNELVFAGLGLANASTATVTAGTGFQLLLQDAPPNTSRAATEGQIVSVSGQYGGTFGLSAKANCHTCNWSAAVATFK
jgi:hypothetical protein